MALVRPVQEGFHAEDTFLPVAMERLHLYGAIPAKTHLFTHASLVSTDLQSGTYRLNVRLINDFGAVFAEILELEMKRVTRQNCDPPIRCMRSNGFRKPWLSGSTFCGSFQLKDCLCLRDNSGAADSLKNCFVSAGARVATVGPGRIFVKTSENRIRNRA